MKTYKVNFKIVAVLKPDDLISGQPREMLDLILRGCDPISLCNAAQVSRTFHAAVDTVSKPPERRQAAIKQFDPIFKEVERAILIGRHPEKIKRTLEAVKDVSSEQILTELLKLPDDSRVKKAVVRFQKYLSDPLFRETYKIKRAIYKDYSLKEIKRALDAVEDVSSEQILTELLKLPDYFLVKRTVVRFQKYQSDPLFRETYKVKRKVKCDTICRVYSPKEMKRALEAVKDVSSEQVLTELLKLPDDSRVKKAVVQFQKYQSDPLFRETYRAKKAIRGDGSLKNIKQILEAVKDVPSEQVLTELLKLPDDSLVKKNLEFYLKYQSDPLFRETYHVKLAFYSDDDTPENIKRTLDAVTEVDPSKVLEELLKLSDSSLKHRVEWYLRYHSDPLFRETCKLEEALQWKDETLENIRRAVDAITEVDPSRVMQELFKRGYGYFSQENIIRYLEHYETESYREKILYGEKGAGLNV